MTNKDLENWFNDLERFLAPITDLREVEMEAIWLTGALRLGTGLKTARITTGDNIAMEGDRIIDCIGEATHKVLGCFGTISGSTLSILVLDRVTGEMRKVKLK